MTDAADNYFRIIERDGGRVQLGADLEHGIGSLEASDLRTVVSVTDPSDAGPSQPVGVLVIQGVLWNPAVGARIELAEPNRIGTVARQDYAINPDGGLVSRVVVYDRKVEGSD